MHVSRFVMIACVVAAAASGGSLFYSAAGNSGSYNVIEKQQVPTWSQDDLNFFLHGSMSTEVVPESVLRAFIKTYPDLFPSSDLTHLGLIPDKEFGWPIGFSRKNVQHLGGMSAIGINCASCHVAQITSTSSQQPIRILGVTSHFNVEGFFGSVLVATFKTSDPENMRKFLAAYLVDSDPIEAEHMQDYFADKWKMQETKIKAAISSDPFGSKGVAPGQLHEFKEGTLRFSHVELANADLGDLSHTMLRLFHNMRTALHVPDQPPDKVPPQSGPGRNDAFGLLSASLLNSPQPYSPIKFGLVWNVGQRTWVHWDATRNRPSRAICSRRLGSVRRCMGNGPI